MDNKLQRISKKIFDKFGVEIKVISSESVNKKTYISFVHPLDNSIVSRKRLDKLMGKKDRASLFMSLNNIVKKSFRLKNNTNNDDNLINLNLNDILNKEDTKSKIDPNIKETINTTINKWDKLREKLNNLNDYVKKNFNNDFKMEITFDDLSAEAYSILNNENGFKNNKKCIF